MEAVAGVELVLDVALTKARAALEYPDLLVDEGVGVRGTGDLRACRQIGLDELEQPAGGGRHHAAPVAGFGIGPARFDPWRA